MSAWFISVSGLQRCDEDDFFLGRHGGIEDLDGWLSNVLKGNGLGS